MYCLISWLSARLTATPTEPNFIKEQTHLEKSRQKYSFVDLFAGAGGLSLGFKLSGFFEPVVAVESDPKAADTYEANLGLNVIRKEVEVAVEELLREANAKGRTSIDAIIGGLPAVHSQQLTKAGHYGK